MSSYIPPWRRGQADGGSPESSSADRPATTSSSYNRAHNNTGRGRAWRGNKRGFRGGRGNYGGRGGGGGGSQNQAQDPAVDEADLYHQRDLANHFSSGEDQGGSYRHTSTFHDSTAHPGQLSYILLFHGANPRWNNDHIVFAKSRLNLLPEYAAKMLEHGPWDLQPRGTVDDSLSPQKADGTAAGESASSEAATSAVDGTETTENEQSCGLDGTPQSTQATAESSSTNVDEGKSTDSPAHSDPGGEDKASSTTTTPAASQTSRMKYIDIRTIPAEELYDKDDEKEKEKENHDEPIFPSIQPIDYIPSTHAPIAIFEERRHHHRGAYEKGGGNGNARFAFAGWYKVARINLLAPHSAELVRMQQQKWERRDRFGRVLPTRARDASAWNAAMSMDWAVVKFEKLGAEEGPPPPAIEKLPEPERRGRGSDDEAEPKSVNEILAEMRLQGTTTTSQEEPVNTGGDGGADEDEAPKKQVGAPVDEDKESGAAQGKENDPIA